MPSRLQKAFLQTLSPSKLHDRRLLRSMLSGSTSSSLRLPSEWAKLHSMMSWELFVKDQNKVHTVNNLFNVNFVWQSLLQLQQPRNRGFILSLSTPCCS